MEIGLIGLGKMGYNLALNLSDHGHRVVGTDAGQVEATDAFEIVSTLEDVVNGLAAPRVVWTMVPAGDITEAVLAELFEKLEPGDIVIDGGNSNYKLSVARAEQFAEKGITFFDCGTSGGTEGARHGACTMVGGDADAWPVIEPIFKDLSVENGYLYTGPAGSGHFLKMIHNGIEYGMMQAIAEGFDILEKSPFDYDYEQVARVWNHGSVVRSWLMELTENAFHKDAKLDEIKGVMHSSGEGKWTVETALDLQAAAPVIALSLMMRYRSLEDDTFTGKVVAALRNEFGGHAVVKK
ncbi:phosphogluconate dehydrogenase (NAD(+)-dependent, decarboxylating) [Exiguobacterium alkaliphilum]|uniref:phosphogluconate dehydrogenase (NAD(+)-dependent, decarboxylating) n=1 Tax=Exiguobacterium alkaliphilum TaxID=1428684 RepID=UPI001BA65C91|nr:decarboxylating 6-phosphogluconate dehydrogenase [Exiguobacterium alkaliphilum]QUE87163.1 decarboxylating 6-phosphogluconate dehydrogenase [Exiguobacterium alkaliphilum]